ncbi:MAG: type II secretion system GspH family protein [Phycisphaerae bacterium]|nr:type II secretion system GspH family protein [Phycisphaerae bacterium]
MRDSKDSAFTLLELLVVMAVMALLMGILMPVLGSARSQAKSLVCRSNLRQLVIAGLGYAGENDGFMVPAARDMWNDSGYHRWHGARSNLNEPFDAAGSPLRAYLSETQVKACPANVAFLSGRQWTANYEQGCGGYGYNMTYLGSRLWDPKSSIGMNARYAHTTAIQEVKQPAMTLMFSDTAMSTDGENLIEYSFAEPPFFCWQGTVFEGDFMSPSVHFRHQGRASVGWTDGHIDMRQAASHHGENAYGVESSHLNLGWFDPVGNAWFDLE